jgi:hypothetical protein
MTQRVHIYKECRSEGCASRTDKSLGNIWGDPLHDILVEDGRQLSKCSVCGHISSFRDPDHKQKLQYPQINMSTGEVFKSRDDEKSYAKKHGLEAVS